MNNEGVRFISYMGNRIGSTFLDDKTNTCVVCISEERDLGKLLEGKPDYPIRVGSEQMPLEQFRQDYLYQARVYASADEFMNDKPRSLASPNSKIK